MSTFVSIRYIQNRIKTFYRSLRTSFCHFTASVSLQELSRTAPTTSSASFRYSTCLFCSFSSLSSTAFLRYSAILSPRARRAVSISSLSFAGRRICVRKEFAIHHYYTSSRPPVKTFLVPPPRLERGTLILRGSCSNQLSYGGLRIALDLPPVPKACPLGNPKGLE